MKQVALIRHLPGGLREPSGADCCDSSCLQTWARQTPGSPNLPWALVGCSGEWGPQHQPRRVVTCLGVAPRPHAK